MKNVAQKAWLAIVIENEWVRQALEEFRMESRSERVDLGLMEEVDPVEV